MSGDLLDARLTELETRVAFQEHSLAEMSDAVADLRSENARLVLMMHRAREDLRQVRSGLSTSLNADPASEPPPPHY